MSRVAGVTFTSGRCLKLSKSGPLRLPAEIGRGDMSHGQHSCREEFIRIR